MANFLQYAELLFWTTLSKTTSAIDCCVVLTNAPVAIEFLGAFADGRFLFVVTDRHRQGKQGSRITQTNEFILLQLIDKLFKQRIARTTLQDDSTTVTSVVIEIELVSACKQH
jgi:hypothetical protein